MVFIRLSQDKYKKLPWRKAKYEDGDVSFYATGTTKDDAVNALLKEIQNKIDKFNKLLLSHPIKIIVQLEKKRTKPKSFIINL